MPERSLKVAIAAETIPYIEGGLGYFLVNAVCKLALAEPSWQFKVVASSSFSQLAQIQMPNVKVIPWDRSFARCATERVLRNLLSDREAQMVSYGLSKYMPSQWLRARWGNLKAIWGALKNVDAVWAPHFTRGSEVCFIEDRVLHFTVNPIGTAGDHKRRGGFFRPLLEWSHFRHE